MSDADLLRRAARDLLKTLRFRRSLGTSWIVTEPRQRYGLVVPTMMTDRHLEYLRSYNGATLRDLHGAGLIMYGPDQEMPPFGYRREWHKTQTRLIGSTISLAEEADDDAS